MDTLELISRYAQVIGSVIIGITALIMLINLIYKFRYYMLIPFDVQNSIKDIPELNEKITEIEKGNAESARPDKAPNVHQFDS